MMWRGEPKQQGSGRRCSVKGSSTIRGPFLTGMPLPVVFLVLAMAMLVQFPLADGYRLQRNRKYRHQPENGDVG